MKRHWSEESRDERLRRQYAITEETYQRIFEKQDGRCAICRCQQHYQRLAVDHDHKTGMVRGLLCTNCNRGLGRFFDSDVRLRNAAAYIEKARATWLRINSPTNSNNNGAAPKTASTETEVKNETLGS